MKTGGERNAFTSTSQVYVSTKDFRRLTTARGLSVREKEDYHRPMGYTEETADKKETSPPA